jgi:hypothetical protein
VYSSGTGSPPFLKELLKACAAIPVIPYEFLFFRRFFSFVQREKAAEEKLKR